MKTGILLLLCLFPLLFFAQKAEDKCGFSVESHIPEQTFSIVFYSPSNDCTNDDQEIYLQTKGKKTRLILPKAWYYDIDNVGNQPSYCKSGYPEYPLFHLEGSRILIILRSNNRPNQDNIAAAIIDVSTSKVLDYQMLGESQKLSTGVLVRGKKYHIQLIRTYLKEMRCDCDASIVEDWLEFQASNGRIKKRWIKNGPS